MIFFALLGVAPCFNDITTKSGDKPLPKAKVECLKTLFGSAPLKTPGNHDVIFRKSQFHRNKEGMTLKFSAISTERKQSRSLLQLHELKSTEFKTYVLQQTGSDEDEFYYDIIFTLDNSGNLIDNMIVGETAKEYTREFAFETNDTFAVKEGPSLEDPENPSGYYGRFHITTSGTFEIASRR